MSSQSTGPALFMEGHTVLLPVPTALRIYGPLLKPAKVWKQPVDYPLPKNKRTIRRRKSNRGTTKVSNQCEELK